MTEKPQARPVDAAYLPDRLCETAKFCNWKFEWDPNRDAWTKIPYNPRTGRRAKSDDPDTFADLDTAVAAEHNHDGVGVGIFGQLVGVDVDHCIDDDGKLSDLAQDIVNTLDTYAEKSPSRTGIHLLCTVPAGFDYDNKVEFYQNNRHNGVEIYVAGKTNRFLTLTGDTLDQDADLAERGDQLRVILDKYMRRATRDPDAPPVDTSVRPTGLTDEQIYNYSCQREKILKLWNGDTSDYDSHSEADLAFCIEMAYWTGRDPARIDQLMRKSDLYREKWDRKDYRDATLDKACKACEFVYTRQPYDDWDRPRNQNAPSAPATFTAHNVSDYIRDGHFGEDVNYFKQYQDRKPGFDNLDEYLTLYPGVCSLGGAASLGKTTFCVNLADNLVKQGETVLYFSLEQGVIELVSKSLARCLYNVDPFAKITNVDIKNGATSDQLDTVKHDYAEAVGDRFIIVRCDFRTTAQDIRDYVEAFIKAHDVRPIVFVDYLQLVAPPPNFRGDQRATVDHNIKTFKTMQLDNELFVVLVSNFNRSGYDTPVSYSDFKETSMIEYTSDYILAMQLTILSEDRFYTKYGPKGGAQNTTDKEKSDMIAAELDQYPKRVQVVSLKNRNGKQSFACNFKYYMWHDVFVPDGETVADSVPSEWYDADWQDGDPPRLDDDTIPLN